MYLTSALISLMTLYRTLQPQILYYNIGSLATNGLLRIRRRSVSVQSLYFVSLPLLRMVVLYSLAPIRFNKLATSGRKKRKLRIINKLLKLMESFNVNYKRKRRGV